MVLTHNFITDVFTTWIKGFGMFYDNNFEMILSVINTTLLMHAWEKI